MGRISEGFLKDTTPRKWVVKKDFDRVRSEIMNFESDEVVLEIKPIRIRPEAILFGCYIPHMPRMTSIISGKILIKKISDDRTELQVLDLFEWARPFIKSLVAEISS